MTKQEYIKKESEKWLPVYGAEDWYEVSNLGRVRSKDRIIYKSDKTIQTLKGKNLSQSTSSNGYKMVGIRFKNGVRNVTVHKLVAEAFILKSAVPKKMCINHIDGVKSNNKFSNLEVVTYQQNQLHAFKTNLCKNIGENHCNAKFKTSDVEKIRELYNGGNMQKDIAAIYGTSQAVISQIVTRKRRATC